MANPLIKFVESVCAQTAVYWGSPVPDGYGGYTYANPVEISVRWDEVSKVITSGDGREFLSMAELLVAQSLDKKGQIYLGDLDDLTTQEKADPDLVEEAFEIKEVKKTPLFRSTTEFVYQVYL